MKSPPHPLSTYIHQELELSRALWETLLSSASPLPQWTWNDLKETFLDLTSSPVEELVLRGALSAIIKEARFKPADQLLSELLRLAVVAHDHGFFTSAQEMLEAEMP